MATTNGHHALHPVAGGLAGLVERGLDAVVDEVEGGPRSNMRLPITLAPVRSNVSRTMSVSRPSSPPDQRPPYDDRRADVPL
jgi:hypothetical protein